jgi:dTDP-4-amino-4,6-dideoxygalactose transaminase
MDGIQGAVLCVKLRHLETWNQKRQQWAAQYHAQLRCEEGIVTPTARPESTHIYHVYAVRVQERDRVLAALQAEGIGCGIHYPVAVHQQKACSGLKAGSFPVTERCAREFLSLPMYAEIGEEMVRGVADRLKGVLEAIDRS